MKDINYLNLLDEDYEKVLSLISKPFKSDSEVKRRYNEVSKLTINKISNDPGALSKIDSGFTIIWNSLPDGAFDVDTIDKLNLRINQFSNYILSTESEYKDHGFSLLVIYYLKVCSDHIRTMTLNK